MTLSLMKALGSHFSTFHLLLSLLAGAMAPRADAAAPAPPAAAGPQMAYPTFCSIPKAPKDVRPPAAFKAAILDTRRAGVALVRSTAPATFGLPASGAGDFASQARAEAAPPPPMNPQNLADAAVFAREARAKATPPARSH